MKLHITANHARSQRGEELTIEMLKAELEETKSLKANTTIKTIAKQQHIAALEAMIKYKEHRQTSFG